MTQTNGKLFGRKAHSAQQALGYVAGVAEQPAWFAAVVVVIRAHLSALKLATANGTFAVLQHQQRSHHLGAKAGAAVTLPRQAFGPVTHLLLLKLAAALGLRLVGGLKLVGPSAGYVLGFGVIRSALGLSLFGRSAAQSDALLTNLFVRVT